MKAWKLALAGLLPFPVGYALDRLFALWTEAAPPYGLIGAAFLLAWAWLGWLLCKGKRGLLRSAAIMHAPALLMLLLALYQEWVRGGFWTNWLGQLPQLFFLPVLNLAGRCLFFVSTVGLAPLCIVSLILLCAAFCVGGALRKRMQD